MFLSFWLIKFTYLLNYSILWKTVKESLSILWFLLLGVCLFCMLFYLLLFHFLLKYECVVVKPVLILLMFNMGICVWTICMLWYFKLSVHYYSKCYIFIYSLSDSPWEYKLHILEVSMILLSFVLSRMSSNQSEVREWEFYTEEGVI